MFAKLKQKTIEDRPKAQSPKPTPTETDRKTKVSLQEVDHLMGIN